MTPLLVPPDRVEKLAGMVAGWRAVVLDWETTGTRPYVGGEANRPLGFAITDIDGDDAYYLPVGHIDGTNIERAALEPLRVAMAGKPLLGFNVKFDLHWWRTFWEEKGELPLLYDVLVAARLMAEEDRPELDLASLAGRHLGFQYTSSAAGHQHQFGSGKFNVHQIGTKCCEDVAATRGLYQFYKERLPDALRRLFGLECRLTGCLFQMEELGIAFEAEALGELEADLELKSVALLESLRRQLANAEFNPRSPPQVAAVMKELGQTTKQSAKGNDQWKREQLLATRHPVAVGIAQYRALAAIQSYLVEELRSYTNQGRTELHGTYANWGTVTGRTSSSGPNLQNFPKGWLQINEAPEDPSAALVWEEEGRQRDISLRRLFVPRQGYEFLVADYRQLEMFIAGYYLRDANFLALLEAEDFHAATAQLVWGGVSPELRRRAKWYNFGLLYGLGLEGLATRIGCSKRQAEIYRRDYFNKIPTYWEVLERVRQALMRHGYIANVYGRRYWLPEERAYVGFNYLVQGSAGDWVKFRLLALWPFCESVGLRPVLTTHDEFVFELPAGRAEEILPPLRRILEDGSKFGMRLPVQLKIGHHNLAELESVDAEDKIKVA